MATYSSETPLLLSDKPTTQAQFTRSPSPLDEHLLTSPWASTESQRSFLLQWENTGNQEKYSKAFITISINRPVREPFASAFSPITLDQLSVVLREAVHPLVHSVSSFLAQSRSILQKFFPPHISSFIFLLTDSKKSGAMAPAFKNRKTFFTLFLLELRFLAPAFLLSKTSPHPIPLLPSFRYVTSPTPSPHANRNLHPPSRKTWAPSFLLISLAIVSFSGFSYFYKL